MFNKILIANRGEIACRIIKTAHKMGIKTVAVYSDADRAAHHVELADEAIHIGPTASRESYLAADKIIAAGKQTGAQAIHPGYGFLSENAGFARQVEAAGITFIGPTHEAIAAMGDKLTSKRLASQAGVNCVPGVNQAIETVEQVVKIARGIGYPVMIKASAGGGGKGLRVAHNDQEAIEGFTSCRNEVRNHFGTDGVFLEKFISAPRHIEIQVIGDHHGNVIHLHERECSIQRRHQKVIEEAPSPFISAATRQAMGEQAVALAKAVKYQNVGTVEFVVGQDQNFYFLEMNTRLQVEHPVTECITGLDLVELMIRVAAGEKLPLTQEEVLCNGWAMECRINAEDPFRNFVPAIGRLVRFQPPEATMLASDAAQSLGVRVDTGVQEGSEIPVHYDSMIAKLIVHGKNRLEAIDRMREALNGFVIRGVSTNIPFQAALLAHPKFVAGEFNTGFIAENYGKGFRAEDVPHEDMNFLVALAAFVHRIYRHRATGITGQMEGHEVEVSDDFAVVSLGQRGDRISTRVRVSDFDVQTGVSLVTVGGTSYKFCSQSKFGAIRMDGICNDKPFTAQVERGGGNNPLAIRLAHNGTQLEALVLSPRVAELYALMPSKTPPEMNRYLLAPMPGLLVEVAVQPGQKVLAGERIAVIEAMKMQTTLLAVHDWVVNKVLAAKGEILTVDQPIIEFV
ncbi:MAG: acetyl/propionyl/methylcrotonyl-CoA carboxylase subunit alpha [Verrucomicrobiota bacterium]